MVPNVLDVCRNGFAQCLGICNCHTSFAIEHIAINRVGSANLDTFITIVDCYDGSLSADVYSGIGMRQEGNPMLINPILTALSLLVCTLLQFGGTRVKQIGEVGVSQIGYRKSSGLHKIISFRFCVCIISYNFEFVKGFFIFGGDDGN